MMCDFLIDGSVKIPEASDDGQLVFRLNLPVREIRLISGAAKPSHLGLAPDHRNLGVALYGLRWQQGESVIDVPVGSHGFIDGFHHLEKDQSDAVPFRWTNGNAALPPDLFPPWRGEALLLLKLKEWRGSEVRNPSEDRAASLGFFESLGVNCEFALAQRHYGVEPPLGLLSWSGTTYEKLMRGLENRFDGIGDPATTTAYWDTYDYRLETPYLNMHTTTIQRQDEAGVAQILQSGCGMLRLLRRKLLKDIAEARRIFIFWSSDPQLGRPEMQRLHRALRAIGPASLLCVTIRTPQQRNCFVESIDEGLYAGYLEKFVIPIGPFDEWLELCCRTLALHRADRSLGQGRDGSNGPG